VLISTAWMMDR